MVWRVAGKDEKPAAMPRVLRLVDLPRRRIYKLANAFYTRRVTKTTRYLDVHAVNKPTEPLNLQYLL